MTSEKRKAVDEYTPAAAGATATNAVGGGGRPAGGAGAAAAAAAAAAATGPHVIGPGGILLPGKKRQKKPQPLKNPRYSTNAELARIQTYLEQYGNDDIYNVLEIRLILKALDQERSQHLSKEQRKAMKMASRVTLLLCTNATGSDRRNPFAIAKYRPKTLSQESIPDMTVQWGEDGNLGKQQFQQWLVELDRDIGRRIVLLISQPLYDHCGDIRLKNVDLVFLPNHIHAAKQPMERGIVRVFKILYSYEMMEVVKQYRREVEEHRLKYPDRKPRILFPLDKLWRLIVPTWRQHLPSYIIRTCFIPVVAPQHKINLSQTFNENDKELEEYNIPTLREDFQQLYPERAKAIEKNKDAEVTLYLHCCESSEYHTPLSPFMESVLNRPEYLEKYAAPHQSESSVFPPVGDDEEYHSDTFDVDFFESEAAL